MHFFFFISLTIKANLLSDYAIWSRVEIPNFDYHANFTDPRTTEFIQLKKLIEKEVSL